MKRAIIIHGWASYPEHGWFPWLRQELEQRGYTVIVPSMPHPLVPTIKDWVETVAQTVGTPDGETLFIGHSMGCQTIIRYLSTQQTPIKGAVFVAGFFELKKLRNLLEEQGAKPWIETPINFDRVRQVLPISFAIFSDKDRYVSYERNSLLFKQHIGSHVILDIGKKHFSGNQGITEVPSILQAVDKIEARES